MAVSAEIRPDASPVELSSEEVARRVAILRRFRELLQAQRDRFRDYLTVLDKQKDLIEQGDAGDLLTHVELEEQIVADIFAIQKVIDPLEAMYRTAYPESASVRAGDNVAPVSEVTNLKTALEDLKTEAIARTERNKALLVNQMDEIRKEIKTLKKNPYKAARPVYSDEGTASLVDIRG
ncbi:MAG: flagellar export chaperone FlgN [Treponema sp.]|jgi:hypothetical protein|nr:flagellar export chaperone FlgN [Treponema sp.]